MSTIRSRAPLRLGLAGGGTDVSPYCDQFGGAVLNATIGLYAHTTVSPSPDGRIHFQALDQQVTESFAVTEAIPIDNRLGLHRGVYERVVRDYCDGKRDALTIATFCDAPPGSGLGSSSTLVVSMLHALAELYNVPLGEYELALMAYQIERIDVGLQGGKQDQYAAAFGGFNFIEFHEQGDVLVNPLRVKDWIVSELESSLLLYYTGQSRSSAAIIEEESRNVREKNEEVIEAMHQTKIEAFRMKDALLRGQVRTMGEVMRTAWGQKKLMATSISNTMIDKLYDVALEAGAFCGKVSGAGGGGFMMFLAEPTKRLAVERALHQVAGGKVIACHFVATGAEAWSVL